MRGKSKRETRPESNTHLPMIDVTGSDLGGLPLSALDRLRSANADLDLLRLSFRAFCQLYLENTVLIAGVDVLRIHGVGQREGARKGAVTPLDAMEVLLLLFFLEVALAANGQRAVLQLDVDVLLVDTGDFQLQCDGVLILININC